MKSGTTSIDGLTERQRLAAHLLAQGKTIREVSRTLNVTEKTIYNYRLRDSVQRAIYYYQQQMMAEGGGRSLTTVPNAMACLAEIVNNPQARDADKIAASKALLGHANSFSERQVLERKLRDLEDTLRLFNDPNALATAEPDDELDPLLPSASPEDVPE